MGSLAKAQNFQGSVIGTASTEFSGEPDFWQLWQELHYIMGKEIYLDSNPCTSQQILTKFPIFRS
jgi:hypothetical protein